MSKNLRLKIITPEKILIDEEVDSVYSHSVEGFFGVLPDHVPYMTALDSGVTEYTQKSKKEFVSIIGGIFQVKENIITILSDKAELGEKIDLMRAKAAKERAEARLKKVSDVDTHRAQAALARAIARIHAASKIR